MQLSLNSPQLAADTNQMGFPKGRSEALPFGHQRSAYSIDDIKLIFVITHSVNVIFQCIRQVVKNTFPD